jgi:hypothetical protein
MQFPIIDPLDTFYLINPSGDPWWWILWF